MLIKTYRQKARKDHKDYPCAYIEIAVRQPHQICHAHGPHKTQHCGNSDSTGIHFTSLLSSNVVKVCRLLEMIKEAFSPNDEGHLAENYS
ncbi:MAG: hypothetical protein NZM04_00540 [Methylacidiphilales bacterium]|nr:hypothetical protein [Candidatus Methylacidiphilales bacterium]